MAKRKAAESESAPSSSLPNETAFLRTSFPVESKIQNATLEPTGEMNWKSDKYKMTFNFDRQSNFWFLRDKDDQCLARTGDLKNWRSFEGKMYKAPVTILDTELRQNKPDVVSSEGAYMHVLQFGGASSSSCGYDNLRGSYYAADFFNGDRAYFCHTNGLHMCRTGDGNSCLKRRDGGHIARTANMGTWFLADGECVNASCWAVKEPKSVIAKNFLQSPNLEQMPKQWLLAARAISTPK